MSTESEEVAITVTTVAARRIERMGHLWISDIGANISLQPIRRFGIAPQARCRGMRSPMGPVRPRVAAADIESRVDVVHFAGHARCPVRKEVRGGVPHLVLRHVPSEQGATGALFHQLAEIANAGGSQRAIGPAETALTRIPSGPRSWAR